MKKLLILVTFLAFGISAIAQSSVLKTGPVGFPFGIVSVCYEKALSDHTSFQFSLSPYAEVKDYNGATYGASLEYRLYITKKEVLKGFYIMPKVGATFGTITEDETSIQRDASSINLIFNLGYQWIWNNGIIIDIGFGPKYSIGTGDNTAAEFDGVVPDVIFGVGYAF